MNENMKVVHFTNIPSPPLLFSTLFLRNFVYAYIINFKGTVSVISRDPPYAKMSMPDLNVTLVSFV